MVDKICSCIGLRWQENQQNQISYWGHCWVQLKHWIPIVMVGISEENTLKWEIKSSFWDMHLWKMLINEFKRKKTSLSLIIYFPQLYLPLLLVNSIDQPWLSAMSPSLAGPESCPMTNKCSFSNLSRTQTQSSSQNKIEFGSFSL